VEGTEGVEGGFAPAGAVYRFFISEDGVMSKVHVGE